MSDWRTHAKCADYPGELWFPHASDKGGIAWAKRICHSACPVRSQCLEWALDKGWDVGIFGGMTESERAAEKTRRGA